MKKGVKKLRLTTETVRQLSPETLRDAEGGAYTDFCTAYCTRVTRCVESCPCYQTDYASCLC